MIDSKTSIPYWQSATFSECMSGIRMNSFSKSLYELNTSFIFIICFERVRETWSKLKAWAWPRKIFRESWSHNIIVASWPWWFCSQCLRPPLPISTKSCWKSSVISRSVSLLAPNQRFIISGGILESRSQPLKSRSSDISNGSWFSRLGSSGIFSTLLMMGVALWDGLNLPLGERLASLISGRC